MPKAYLTQHFSFDELTASAEHPELVTKNRLEASVFLPKLKEVCEKLLEPVRAVFGPVVITSGYRCPALNEAIGGSPTSQHCNAEAADFVVPGQELDEVFDYVRLSAIPFGQLILEQRGSKRWLHISLGEPYRPKDKCRQVLTYDGRIYKPVA